MGGEVKVHGFWASHFSYRVIWALKLKGVEFEYIEEDIPDNKSELLLKYNPVHKMIPVLVCDGKPVAESLIILEFIDETWLENPLMSKDPHERATERFWIDYGVNKVGPLIKGFARAKGLEGTEKAGRDLIEALRIVEDQGLGDKKYFGGEAINLVDISYGFLAHWFVAWEEVRGFKVVEPNSLPRLHQWANTFKQFPAIKDNLPDYHKLLAFLSTKKEKSPKK